MRHLLPTETARSVTTIKRTYRVINRRQPRRSPIKLQRPVPARKRVRVRKNVHVRKAVLVLKVVRVLKLVVLIQPPVALAIRKRHIPESITETVRIPEAARIPEKARILPAVSKQIPAEPKRPD